MKLIFYSRGPCGAFIPRGSYDPLLGWRDGELSCSLPYLIESSHGMFYVVDVDMNALRRPPIPFHNPPRTEVLKC